MRLVMPQDHLAFEIGEVWHRIINRNGEPIVELLHPIPVVIFGQSPQFFQPIQVPSWRELGEMSLETPDLVMQILLVQIPAILTTPSLNFQYHIHRVQVTTGQNGFVAHLLEAPGFVNFYFDENNLLFEIVFSLN